MFSYPTTSWGEMGSLAKKLGTWRLLVLRAAAVVVAGQVVALVVPPLLSDVDIETTTLDKVLEIEAQMKVVSVPCARLMVDVMVLVKDDVGVETTVFVEVATDFRDVAVTVPVKVLKSQTQAINFHFNQLKNVKCTYTVLVLETVGGVGVTVTLLVIVLVLVMVLGGKVDDTFVLVVEVVVLVAGGVFVFTTVFVIVVVFTVAVKVVLVVGAVEVVLAVVVEIAKEPLAPSATTPKRIRNSFILRVDCRKRE